MRGPKGAWWPRFVLSLSLAMLPQPARADYKDAYKKGWEAANRRRWDEAIRFLQEAIAERPVEGESIRFYGQRYEDYFPHYWLGFALANAGECARARAAFEASESQGVIQRSSLYRTLVKMKQRCGREPSPPPPAPPGPDPAAVTSAAQAADAAIKRAEDAARTVVALQADTLLGPVWSKEPSLGPAQKRAQDTLSIAQVRLKGGREKMDLAQLAEAKDLAERALRELETIRGQAAKIRKELQPTATPSAPIPSVPRPPSPPLPGPLGPPPQLLKAARFFFSAEYQKSLEALEGLGPATGPAEVQSLLFRSAARYALYVVGGEKDENLLREAAADARSCRRLAPDLRPDRLAFSPRFVEFFQNAR